MSAAEPSRVVCVAQGSGDDPSDFSRIRLTGSQTTDAATEQADWCFVNTAPGEDTVVQVELQREGWIEAIVFSMKPILTGRATNRFERLDP